MKIVSLEEQSFKVHSSHTPTFFIPDPPFGKRNHIILELQTTSFYKWLFELDDSKSVHKNNWLFHQTSIKKNRHGQVLGEKKHPLKNGCLGYPDLIRSSILFSSGAQEDSGRFPLPYLDDVLIFFLHKMLIEKLGITWGY